MRKVGKKLHSIQEETNAKVDQAMHSASTKTGGF